MIVLITTTLRMCKLIWKEWFVSWFCLRVYRRRNLFSHFILLLYCNFFCFLGGYIIFLHMDNGGIQLQTSVLYASKYAKSNK